MRLTGTPLLLVTSVTLLGAVVCHVVAMATHFWLQSASTGDRTFLNIGLWVACFKDYEHLHEHLPRRYDGCHSLFSDYYGAMREWLVPHWLLVCQVLSVIALVFLLTSAVLFVAFMLCVVCKLTSCDNFCLQRTLLYATPITCFLAGLFLTLTLAVFADNAFRLQCKDYWVSGKDPNNNFIGFSWGFELVACLLSMGAAGLVLWLAVLKRRDDI